MASSEDVMRGWFPTWQDAVGYLTSTLGKGATRAIANQAGVSMRTAQRWAKAVREGRSMPKFNKGAADALRALAAARKVSGSNGRVRTPGGIKVSYESKPQGRRNPPQPLGLPKADLGGVAALLAAGRWAEAAEEFDAALLEAYGDGMGDSLDVDDYPGGMDLD